MPGRLRWPHISGDVVARRPATVVGALYDTRRGYPALVLNGAGGPDGVRVSGWLLGLADDEADAVLDRLDRVEGRAAGAPVPGHAEPVLTHGAWALELEDER